MDKRYNIFLPYTLATIVGYDPMTASERAGEIQEGLEKVFPECSFHIVKDYYYDIETKEEEWIERVNLSVDENNYPYIKK